MARGITENDVHTAADALVAAGERPTVERIRAHLGTGSPNTVTRWLETWWQGLGNRLDGHQARLAVPDAPEAVARAAGQWWGLALEEAKESLEASLSDERAALQSERDDLRKAREALDAEATALRADTEAALASQRLAETQSTELTRLVSRVELQLEELTRQRDAAIGEKDESEASRQAVEQRLQALQASADVERDGFLRHIRAVEERANTEIDRTRLEAKELKSQVRDLGLAHAAAEKSARQQLDQANVEAKEAQRELSVQRSRAEAAESRLAQLQEVSDVVEAAIRRAGASTGSAAGRKKTANPAQKKRTKIAGNK